MTKYLKTSDKVFFRVYRNGKDGWEDSKIIKRIGKMMYTIEGLKWEHDRHINQLKKFAEEKVTRKEVLMEVLYNIFDAPTLQEIIKSRCNSTRKRKQMELLEAVPKQKILGFRGK